MFPPLPTPTSPGQPSSGAEILVFPRPPAGAGVVARSMTDLRKAVADLRAALADLANNTESLDSSLKHYQDTLGGLDRQVRALNGAARQLAATADSAI